MSHPNVTPWGDPANVKPLMTVRVRVTTQQGRQHQFEGKFRHTFDAYDSALARYPNADRIECQKVLVDQAAHADTAQAKPALEVPHGQG